MTPIDLRTCLPLEYDDPNLQVAMDAMKHDPVEDAENAQHDRRDRLDEQSDRSRWLPPVVAPPNPGGHPTGLRPVCPPAAGEQAGGLHLPDLAA